MKILLSAFSCLPNSGSEPGVGWRWALELASEHEVVVVTDITRRSSIDPYLNERPVPGLRVVYFRPAWLRSISLNSWTAQFLYLAWQFGLLAFARSLHRVEGFDAVMHVTYGVFRHPSFLGYLGVPFIFGPLGGGEDVPWRLKRSIRGREKLKEALRSVVNKLSLIDPFLWSALAKATAILVKTEETRLALPWPFRARAIVFPEIGVDGRFDGQLGRRTGGEPLRVLFAGRLLGWKGAHLAIEAVALARRKGVLIDFTLVGRGPYQKELMRLSAGLGSEGSVNWINQIPQAELFDLYRTMHCFLFPSLHDSSGNVVLEAQASGLPIICLDVGGPATLVTSESAIVVSTKGNEVAVVEALAEALRLISADEDRRRAMGEAAVRQASRFTWRGRALGALALVTTASDANYSEASVDRPPTKPEIH